MKKSITLVLAFIFLVANSLPMYGNTHTDYLVFSASIDNTFIGSQESTLLNTSLRFNDLNNHWAHESIIHGGSLRVINSAGENFNPNTTVSNQQALEFAVNIMGVGNEAQRAALELQEEFPQEASLGAMLPIGYMEVARQRDIITTEEFEVLTGIDAIATRNNPVTREQMATWVARALISAGSESVSIDNQPQTIQSFSDWESVSLSAAPYVEALVSTNIMSGTADGNFNPQGSLTRAEMAQILRNMNQIYYDIAGLERKTGTFAAFRDVQELTTLHGDVWRNYYIRTASGGVDVLQHQIIQNSSGSTVETNTVVFRNGIVGGFEILIPGDQIEYIVNPETNTVLYINVVNTQQVVTNVQGRLISVDTTEGTVTIRDDNDRSFNYNMVQGMYGNDTIGEYIFMDRKQVRRQDFPIGSIVELNLINNLVNEISFIGQPVHTLELRGIVVENNPDFGFLTVIDNNGNLITRQYNSNNIRVQRENFYQTGNNIGYISQMFPNFIFNPADAYITEIVPGDIVFMRFDENDPNVIVNISSVANYTARHGLIRQISSHNNRTQVLVQFDNNQTSWFELPPNVFVSSQGRPVPHNHLQVGDRVRMLVNQAIIGPGHIMESLLEVVIEGDGHHISTIMTGNLAGFNQVQNQMMVRNARELTQPGWGNHNQIQELDTSFRDIEYFHEAQRISLDHANRFLSRSDLNVYVAIDNSAGGRVRRVTFRDGRDELLRPDTVINADGNGNFEISSVNGTISTDNGTIVRRNGRMVTGSDIRTGDFLTVSLSGGNRAAIVDIKEAPSTSAVNIARGRILNVQQGRSFTVQSMSVLLGNNWVFTPIEREFTISPNTLFLDQNGFVDPSRFIDYTSDSVFDNVYTIIYDGSMATHVIDAPYANRSVRGTIYNITNDGAIQIREAQHLNNTTGVWNDISRVDNTMNINTLPNSIIVRNNAVVQPRNLQVGDRIRVLTTTLPTMESGVTVPGYIILVER